MKQVLTLIFLSLYLNANAQSYSELQDENSEVPSYIFIRFDTIDKMLNSDRNDSALILSNKVLEWAINNNNDSIKAEALLFKGIAKLATFGPRDVSTKLFLESLEIFTRLNIVQGMICCNLQLGIINIDIQNYSSSAEYLKDILEYEELSENRRGVVEYLLAISYSELGEFVKAEQLFNSASEKLSPNSPMFNLQIQTFLGKMFTNQNNPQKAIKHFNNLLVDNDSLVIAENYNPIFAFLSTAYLELGAYDSAIHYGRIAYQMAEGRGAAHIYFREAGQNLYKAFEAVGDFDSAYLYLSSLSNVLDSLANKNILQRVAELSSQYEFEQAINDQKAQQALKDAIVEKELQRKKFIRNSFLGGFFLALLVAGLVISQRNKLSKEKKRSDALLLNILPVEIAQELKDTGRAEAKDFESVSVLFTDFKAFTQHSELLPAKELVAEINTCFEAFDNIMEKYRIEKIKTIGDAYMAAGGLPIPSKNSAKRTVLAAIEMQQFINSLKVDKEAMGKSSFEMRVGINTGPVAAGIVGVKKFQYDIWGDTVNTASRIESNGEVGKVNVSDATYQLINNEPEFEFIRRGKMPVKGKGEIEMWFVSLKEI